MHILVFIRWSRCYRIAKQSSRKETQYKDYYSTTTSPHQAGYPNTSPNVPQTAPKHLNPGCAILVERTRSLFVFAISFGNHLKKILLEISDFAWFWFSGETAFKWGLLRRQKEKISDWSRVTTVTTANPPQAFLGGCGGSCLQNKTKQSLHKSQRSERSMDVSMDVTNQIK